MRPQMLILTLTLAACSGTEAPDTSGDFVPFADLEITQDIIGKWSRSCALCHVQGEGGAPRLGDRDDWQEWLAQGENQLLTHAIQGYNRMPALGYCMACELDDLRALIKLMATGDAS